MDCAGAALGAGIVGSGVEGVRGAAAGAATGAAGVVPEAATGAWVVA